MMASDRETRKKLRQNFPIAPLSILQKIRRLYPSPLASDGEFENQFDRINALISGPSSFYLYWYQNGFSTVTSVISPMHTVIKHTITAIAFDPVSMQLIYYWRLWTWKSIGREKGDWCTFHMQGPGNRTWLALLNMVIQMYSDQRRQSLGNLLVKIWKLWIWDGKVLSGM